MAPACDSWRLTLPQYVASGIFAKMTPSNLQHLRALRSSSASHVYHKSLFLGAALLPEWGVLLPFSQQSIRIGRRIHLIFDIQLIQSRFRPPMDTARCSWPPQQHDIVSWEPIALVAELLLSLNGCGGYRWPGDEVNCFCIVELFTTAAAHFCEYGLHGDGRFGAQPRLFCSTSRRCHVFPPFGSYGIQANMQGREN